MNLKVSLVFFAFWLLFLAGLILLERAHLFNLEARYGCSLKKKEHQHQGGWQSKRKLLLSQFQQVKNLQDRVSVLSGFLPEGIRKSASGYVEEVEIVYLNYKEILLEVKQELMTLLRPWKDRIPGLCSHTSAG